MGQFEDDSQTFIEPLSPREMEVIELISNGSSNRTIAEKLFISIDTVKWYNKKIFMKLGVKNRTQAARKFETIKATITLREDEVPYRTGWSTNLPAELTSYVGRERETAEVCKILEHQRMVTLTGSGGSGKTRLALKTGRMLQNHFRDGVCLVELAVEDDPERIPQMIASELKIVGRYESETVEGLIRYLNQKHLLLILDNFEHLLTGSKIVGKLLAACSQLTILATSREKLHLYGEQEYPVLPLDVPDLTNNEPVDELLNYGAIKLFIERAKTIKPGFIFDDDQVRHVIRICGLLDGLPLAIELCAPQIKYYSPAEIATRLENSLDFLPEGPRDLPDRQRTLRATLEWSHNLLSEEEQMLFTRLAVFKGGGIMDAIEKVCGKEISGKVSDILFSLVDKNLVNPRERGDGEIYFTLLETMREINHDRLIVQKTMHAINKSHAQYYAEIAEQARVEIYGSRNRYWYTRLNIENDNLRSALEWSITHNETEYVLQLIGSLLYHWEYNGLAGDCLRWEDEVKEIIKTTNPRHRAGVLLNLGVLSYTIGAMEKSQTYTSEAVKLYQEMGDGINEAWSTLYMGLSFINSGDKILAGLDMGEKALNYMRKNGDIPHLAHGLNILGEIARVAGRYDTAKTYYEECLSLVKETGESIREAIEYINLGYIAYHQEKYEYALELGKRALRMFLEMGSFYGMANHLASFAGPVEALGYYTRAARMLGAANANLDSSNTGQHPSDQIETRIYLRNVQKALGKKAFERAWEEGQRMTIQQAIEYALSDLEGSKKH